jgi:hypothetical protein
MQTIAEWITFESLQAFTLSFSSFWVICEIFHFIGLALLIGTVGLLDLRLLGVAKSLPAGQMQPLIRWGIVGFVLCFLTGTVFVSGDPFKDPIVHLQNPVFLVKMAFVLLAGLNLWMFRRPGMQRAVEDLGPGDDAPRNARIMAGTSLFLWLGVIYCGRMLPWRDAFYFVFYW